MACTFINTITFYFKIKVSENLFGNRIVLIKTTELKFKCILIKGYTILHYEVSTLNLFCSNMYNIINQVYCLVFVTDFLNKKCC